MDFESNLGVWEKEFKEYQSKVAAAAAVELITNSNEDMQMQEA